MDLLGPIPKPWLSSPPPMPDAPKSSTPKTRWPRTGLGQASCIEPMLLDQMNGDDGELNAQRAAADREWTHGHIVVDEAVN